MTVRTTFPGWQLYVFGLDVSLDVKDISTNWSDEQAPDTFTFTLNNPQDRYMVSGGDLHEIYGDIPVDAMSTDFSNLTPEKQEAHILATITEKTSTFVTDDAKRRVLLAKLGEGTRIKGSMSPVDSFRDETTKTPNLIGKATKDGPDVSSLHRLAANRGEFLRFPLLNGHPIFHAGDPVRLFLRDPYNPNEWYFGFTGQLADWSEEMDSNGASIIRFVAKCSLRQLLIARIMTNWALNDMSFVTDEKHDSVFISWFKENFNTLTLPQLLYMYIFGPSKVGSVNLGKDVIENGKGVPSFDTYYYGATATQPTPIKAAAEAIGLFNYEDSEIHIIGTDPTLVGPAIMEMGEKKFIQSSPGIWQGRIDHRVPLTWEGSSTIPGVKTLALPQFQEPDASGVVSEQLEIDGLDVMTIMQRIGEHPEIYPCTYGRLMMCLPASLAPGTNRDILFRDVASNVAQSTQFVNRLSVIYSIAERLQHSFYATPRGDLVFEMPFHAFLPEDFNEWFTTDSENLRFTDRYRFGKIDTISYGNRFSEDSVRTLARVDYLPVKGISSTGTASSVGFKPGVAIMKPLIPLFGIRPEPSEPYGNMSTLQAAEYHAQVMLSKANANAWVDDVTTCMHIGVGPNRPCWFEVRDFIATTRRVSTSIVWKQSVSQKLTTNFHRGWSGQMLAGKPTVKAYEYFGGMAAQPLNYREYYSFQDNSFNASTKALTPARKGRGGKMTPAEYKAEVAAILSRQKTEIKFDRKASNAAKRALAEKYEFPPGSDKSNKLLAQALAQNRANNWHSSRLDPSIAVPGSAEHDALVNLAKLENPTGEVGKGNFMFGLDTFDYTRKEATIAKLRSGTYTPPYTYSDGNYSTAAGLGQLTYSNASLMPSGVRGYGDPTEEMQGWLAYINDRYGSAAAALAYRKANGIY